MRPRSGTETVVRVTGTDRAGDPVARPDPWDGADAAPLVLMQPEARGQPALVPGERVLARLRRTGPSRYEGRTLKRLSDAPSRIVGVFRPTGSRTEAGRLAPTDRRQQAEWSIPPGATMDAGPDEIVLAEPLPSPGYGLKPARVVERLGRLGEARSVSLVCLAMHDIPRDFPPEATEAAGACGPVDPAGRTDLRDLELVTIDGEDARDFDDAVFAEPCADGWRLVVAIADVAHYVRPGGALDREAYRRGNSVYFPDRVVPMLPEALSNGWCSLRAGEDRGCLFAELRIDAEGRKLSHRFGRGLMRAAARLTYAQVQQTHEAYPALYGAFRALLSARRRRGALDLDLPERQVALDASGDVLSVTIRPRLDSHRLVEEIMVLANVAAAEELRRLRQPCVARIHAPPAPERLEGLRRSLASLGLSLNPAGALRPGDLDAILTRVADTESAPLVNEMVLRAQARAEYSPDDTGHFGLGLPTYAHFTSPIRRYADLLVHRALITGLGLGDDGMQAGEAAELEAKGKHITATERRAALAERDATARYIAATMADKIGLSFEASISGVTRSGIFITVLQTGASGLVPLSTLPDDVWVHDETANALIGRRSRISYRLTQRVEVRLTGAAALTGGLLFALDPPAASARP